MEISDKTIEEVKQLRLAQEEDYARKKEQVFGKLMNERWMLSQDGGRCAMHVDGMFQVLYDNYGIPVIFWGGYEIRDGETHFYGRLGGPKDAVRFVQGEEVEVLT